MEGKAKREVRREAKKAGAKAKREERRDKQKIGKHRIYSWFVQYLIGVTLGKLAFGTFECAQLCLHHFWQAFIASWEPSHHLGLLFYSPPLKFGTREWID